MKCKNPGKCLQPAPASVFCFAQAKGLWWTMRAFRIVVRIKATTAQLVDLYVNTCLRWWLFNIVNAFGLKDVGFIRLLKPISVLVVNNRVPAPFSKMYTNSLRNLSKFSNTLSCIYPSYLMKGPQATLKASALTPLKHANKFPTETQTFLSGRYHVLWQRTTSAS